MKKYFNFDLVKILISVFLFVVSLFFGEDSYIKLSLLIVSYVVVSYEIYIEAFKNVKTGEIFDENFLMIIATIGAFIIGEFSEGVIVILLFQLGEYLSDLAVSNSKEAITKLLDLRCDFVNLKEGNKIKREDVKKVKIGDVFIVKPGEKIPLDGEVIEGESYVDTSSLTGESAPIYISIHDKVLSGYINNDSVITVKATSVFETSTATKIIELIENSNEKRSDTENFIRKFCKVYTPVVVLCAILLVLIPTFMGYDFDKWLYRCLVFLVTSCPCALVISVPLGYFCGIGRASREGILIKGSSELDKLRGIDYILFDKTGTITEGVFEVTKIKSLNKKVTDKRLLELVSSAEEFSNHPIAKAIQNKFGKKSKLKVEKFKEFSGGGISCRIADKDILIGNKQLLTDKKIDFEEQKELGTIVYIAIDHQYCGYIVISDKIKESSKNLVKLLKMGIKELIILSGDNKEVVESVSKKLKIDNYFGELLPIDKVNKVEEYRKKGSVMFVGDGINDAPVLKISDVGVSMGGIGSDAAIEASDVVLMRDDLGKIEDSIKISRLTKKLISVSILFALVVKFVVLLLGVLGISTIWMAVFADVGVTLLSVLNVLRIMWKKI